MDLNRFYAFLPCGLPPDAARLMAAGDLEAAKLCLDVHRADDRVPEPAQRAMLAMRHILDVLPQHYTVPRQAALAQLRGEIPDFTQAEFDQLFYFGTLDWRYIGGQPLLLDSFADTLRLYPTMQQRGMKPDSTGPDVRDAVIAYMKEHGGADAVITLKASIAPPEGTDPATPCKAWLPLPAACAQQSEIEILEMTPGGKPAPADAPQRTLYWEATAGDAPFEVKYRYRIHADYVDLDQPAAPVQPAAELPAYEAPEASLAEQAPHILFTPYLRALCAEITQGCAEELAKARAIYDYVTQNTNYRYQPAYCVMENISEHCAKSGQGDCGVMALLFITLCRIAGVPARWQSGLYVRPGCGGQDAFAGSHDWAMFWLPTHGWLWADCSFGSGANRENNELRRRFYFGNLDPLRMVANRAFYAPLTPPDEAWRSDPYDNQSGELVLAGEGLLGSQFRSSVQLVEYRTDMPL